MCSSDLAAQFERERLGAAFEPYSAADRSFDAIINLTAQHAIVNSKRHGEIYLPPVTEIARTKRVDARKEESVVYLTV